MSGKEISGRCTQGSLKKSAVSLKILLIYLALSPYLLSTVYSQVIKKNNPSRPFYVGSRYGRAGQQSHVQVTPRVDKFFLGSRYGKRAVELELPIMPNSNEFQDEDMEKTIEHDSEDMNIIEALVLPENLHDRSVKLLKCIYLGKGALYNCITREINTSEPL